MWNLIKANSAGACLFSGVLLAGSDGDMLPVVNIIGVIVFGIGVLIAQRCQVD